MFCLSIREPWVTAIFRLGKNVENRTWRIHYRGRIGIHVSGNVNSEALQSFGLTVRDLFPRGCVVGFVELYDITEKSKSKWAKENQWHWLIRNPILIKPVRLRGRVGLFRADTPFE